MAVQQLHDGNSEGVQIAAAATDKVGFYGKTPAVRAAHITDGSDATTTQAAVNAILVVLENLGFTATS